MYANQHISKEENETISGALEKSAVADSAEPKTVSTASFPHDLDGWNAGLAGVLHVTLFCPVRAEQILKMMN
jgi:hypothetical protein